MSAGRTMVATIAVLLLHIAPVFLHLTTAYDQHAVQAFIALKRVLEYLQEFGYLPEPAHGVGAMLSETVVEEAIRELQIYGKVPRIEKHSREYVPRIVEFRKSLAQNALFVLTVYVLNNDDVYKDYQMWIG
ncbi:unnamed protein product [Gongylonema pulchrum]|uniref:ANF_receptor domain-containing protein n=1 Tax=Gongylonema pulchrum TaxID=637853 RepID=A0A183DA98_9BILA|nr:unnamed protein product [Gongylonema pulchrum]